MTLALPDGTLVRYRPLHDQGLIRTYAAIAVSERGFALDDLRPFPTKRTTAAERPRRHMVEDVFLLLDEHGFRQAAIGATFGHDPFQVNKFIRRARERRAQARA